MYCSKIIQVLNLTTDILLHRTLHHVSRGTASAHMMQSSVQLWKTHFEVKFIRHTCWTILEIYNCLLNWLIETVFIGLLYTEIYIFVRKSFRYITLLRYLCLFRISEAHLVLSHYLEATKLDTPLIHLVIFLIKIGETQSRTSFPKIKRNL